MGRSPCCEKGHTTKGAWTKEEDRKLIDYIKAHGDGCWKSLPSAAGLSRCGKSCRLRWINYLRPDLKRGNFTAAEEQRIIQLHEKLGNKWSVIAMNLPGRTDNEIKNYWNTHIRRKLLSQGIDPQTHKQISPAKTQAVDPQTRNQISAASGAAQANDPQTNNQISAAAVAAAVSFSPSQYRPVQYDGALGSSKIPDSAAVSAMQSRLKRRPDALSGSSSGGGGGGGDGGFVDSRGGVCLCFHLGHHSCEVCTGQSVPSRFIQPKLEEGEQMQSD